ncbi:hypothetical protein P691DRAFT_716957 [Macrolepiota fuliginosa MF-IS2]|uniref:SAP domain-containing protein n=1 Tax=Macrolepiota fuliginosa MF-IS2 TaxID=1400762 RepID=A0A9P5XN50_9AGAR|nr:hypothetical protein P691DRAFT_716957 [Macrolepiota fuliginosa MF-IS2]
MLRLVPAVRPLIAHRGQIHRSFVSPILLTRTWQNESVATLRKEAKNRGLSAKGTKANLILRIAEHDAQSPPKDVSAPTPANTRSASSAAAPKPSAPEPSSHTVAPGPGVPRPTITTTPPPYLNIVIPDLSQPDPEPPVDVPYVPDFWDSTAFQKQAEPIVAEDLPKVVLVGGVSTYADDGPTHNLEPVSEMDVDTLTTPTSSQQTKKSPGETGLFEDITHDLGIPPPKELKQNFWKLFS